MGANAAAFFAFSVWVLLALAPTSFRRTHLQHGESHTPNRFAVGTKRANSACRDACPAGIRKPQRAAADGHCPVHSPGLAGCPRCAQGAQVVDSPVLTQ